MAIRTAEPMTLTVPTSKDINITGRMVSRLPTSLLKRFKILPIGVLSKKLILALMTLVNIWLCCVRLVLRPANEPAACCDVDSKAETTKKERKKRKICA